jgi:hypothetical protein
MRHDAARIDIGSQEISDVGQPILAAAAFLGGSALNHLVGAKPRLLSPIKEAA